MLDEMLLLVMQRKAMVMDEVARNNWQTASDHMTWFIENKIEVRWNPTKQAVLCWWNGNSVDWVTNDPRVILDLYQLVQREGKRVPRVKAAAVIWAEKQGYMVQAVTVEANQVVITTTCETPCGNVVVTVPLDDAEFGEDTPLDVLAVAEANLMAQASKVLSHHEAELVMEQAGVALMKQRHGVAA